MESTCGAASRGIDHGDVTRHFVDDEPPRPICDVRSQFKSPVQDVSGLRCVRSAGSTASDCGVRLHRVRHLRPLPLDFRHWHTMPSRALITVNWSTSMPTRNVVLTERQETLIVSGTRIPLLSAGLREVTCLGRTGSASKTGAKLRRRLECCARRFGRRADWRDCVAGRRELGDRRCRRSGTGSAATDHVRACSLRTNATRRAAAAL